MKILTVLTTLNSNYYVGKFMGLYIYIYTHTHTHTYIYIDNSNKLKNKSKFEILERIICLLAMFSIDYFKQR